jgi:hypothetical protein
MLRLWAKRWQTLQGVTQMKNSSQTPKRKAKLTLVAGSCAIAGLAVAGITLSSAASASTNTPVTSTPAPSETPWHSNTDASHEANESAAQKAAEVAADAKGVAPDGNKWAHRGDGDGDGDHAKKSGTHESDETSDPETSDAPESPTTSDSPSTSS